MGLFLKEDDAMFLTFRFEFRCNTAAVCSPFGPTSVGLLARALIGRDSLRWLAGVSEPLDVGLFVGILCFLLGIGLFVIVVLTLSVNFFFQILTFPNLMKKFTTLLQEINS